MVGNDDGGLFDLIKTLLITYFCFVVTLIITYNRFSFILRFSMKKIVWLVPLLLALIIPAHANYDFYKKNTVKLMYKDATIASARDYRSDELDTLYTYSDRELQNAIALVQSDSKSRYEGSEDGITNCNEVRYVLKLTTGNGYSITEAKAVDYKVLNNGRVRASLSVEGYGNIDDYDFDNFKDFSLTCSGESCKITDIYDYRGESGISAADKHCR